MVWDTNFSNIVHDLVLLHSLGVRWCWFTVPVRKLKRLAARG
jgi:hypothetical protein